LEVRGGIWCFEVIMEMFGCHIVDVHGVEKYVVGAGSDGGEIIVGDFRAESVADCLLSLVGCGLIRHLPSAVRGLTTEALPIG
jgi:hypothetical protein